jgi:hypothetical protein
MRGLDRLRGRSRSGAAKARASIDLHKGLFEVDGLPGQARQ